MAKQQKSKAAQSDDFISDDVVSSGSGRYLNIKKSDTTKFRCISKPIFGWVEWIDKAPVRTPLEDGEPEATDADNPPKKFMALAVYDYEDAKVKILELTQQSIIKAIKALAQNADWGSPFGYDINISKTGEGLKTKYSVLPSNKKATSKDIIREANASPCNLEALYEGEDPWNVEGGEETEYHFK